MTTTIPAADVRLIPLPEIRDVGNVRRELRDIASLAASIRLHGLLTAIAVEALPEGGYRLAAGSRRFAAAQLAELDAVPAVIVPPGGDAEALLRRLAENRDRDPLTDLEEADAIQQALGADSDSLAAALHTTPDNIEAWRAVATLPAQVRELIDSGLITPRDTHQLVPISGDTDLLDDCLRRVAQGWSVKSAVDNALAEKKRRIQEEKTRARLAKEACPIVPAPQYGQLALNSRMQHLGQGYGDVRMARRKHAKEPCHAAYLDPTTGRAVYVCTDRARHAGVDGSGVPDLKAERAAKRAAKKALRQAHAERFRTVGEALRNRAVSHGEAVSHVLRLWVAEAKPAVGEIAAELLGLVAPDDEILAAEKALEMRAAESDEGLVDVALAIAVGAGEHGLTTDRYDYSTEAVGAYLRFLQATGIHELTGAEMTAALPRLPWEMRHPEEAEREDELEEGQPATESAEPAAASADAEGPAAA